MLSLHVKWKHFKILHGKWLLFEWTFSLTYYINTPHRDSFYWDTLKWFPWEKVILYFVYIFCVQIGCLIGEQPVWRLPCAFALLLRIKIEQCW